MTNVEAMVLWGCTCETLFDCDRYYHGRVASEETLVMEFAEWHTFSLNFVKVWLLIKTCIIT